MRNMNLIGRSVLIVAMMLLFTSLQSFAQRSYSDVNNDGEVNVSDVNALIETILTGKDNSGTTSPETGFLSAKEFGAVGDGVTDDTQALERLFAAAFEVGKAVFFDPGTYLIRRSLTLRSGMEIYGDQATIKKKAAITTSLTAAAVKDQTYIDVADASGFNVGDQFYIHDSSGANWCTYGIVTAIDGNRISFTNIISDHQSNFPGCVRACAVGAKVSTSFALLRSWTARFECDGVYIHDLTLDGNRTNTEPKSWANSCIHLDSYYGDGYTGGTGIQYRTMQRNLVARNLVILNAPHDGISDQGKGGLVVEGCVIKNSAMHGVHMGTIFANAMIYNNVMTGNGTIGAGVFCCQDVTNVIVDGNQISGFNHGCSDEEFGTAGKFLIIRNNEFSNITGYVFDFLKATATSHGGGVNIYNNKISGLKAAMFSGDYLDDVVISNNTIQSVTTPPANLIRIIESNNVIITGNKVTSGTGFPEAVYPFNTTNLIQNGNSWD